jgi:hypothetical protein
MNREKELLKNLIREIVEEIVLEQSKKRRSNRRKPGGGLTDLGALRRLRPREYNAKVRTALMGGDGDVSDSAKELGIASRTLYQALEDSPSLQNFKDRIDREEEETTTAAEKNK